MHTDAVPAVLRRLQVWLQLQQLSLSAQAVTWPFGHTGISICVLWLIFFLHSPRTKVALALSQLCLMESNFLWTL